MKLASTQTMGLSSTSPVLSLVGNTPLIPLKFKPEGITIWVKCEQLNPSGSIKDRFAKAVILDAVSRGVLHADSIILECTSGNTGIALAMVGAAMGIRVAILMSESASHERRQLIQQLGGELILFGGAGHYQEGIDLSRKMAAGDDRYFLPRQFENVLNIEDHEHFTGQEILAQAPAPIDAFVAGFGTGGTLAGCSRAIKSRFPKALVYAMEPADTWHPGECPCCHVVIEGVANGFQPPLLGNALIDGTLAVRGEHALEMTRRLHREFGLLVGTSSGANVSAALQVAAQLGPDATVVTLLCDRAERYFSTDLFAVSRAVAEPAAACRVGG